MTILPRCNVNAEFLITISKSLGGDMFFVYDITAYLPVNICSDRTKRLKNVRYELKGKEYTVYVLNFEQDVTRSEAIEISRRFISGEGINYRLD